MTIFSGVVAILSPTLMSRLPTYASDKTRGPCALGTVLERMQSECGVACTRTAENVCMVQGEWEAIRKAHAFLDHHDALNKFCRPSPEPTTKKARRDRSPEPEAPVLAPTVASVASPTNRCDRPSPKPRSSSPSMFPGLLCTPEEAMLKLVKREPVGPTPNTITTTTTTPTTAPHVKTCAAPRKVVPLPVAAATSSTTRTTQCNAPKQQPPPGTPQHQHTSSPTPGSGRSGAMKRKQGIPRKQVQNFGASDEDSDGEEYKMSVNAPNIAQNSPAFANGDSSFQIVATWGNFKEENINAIPGQQPKTEQPSDEENRYYDSEREGAKGAPSRMPGAGMYTLQSDGQGGTVILPSVAEPVYVLNMTSAGDDYSGSESLYGYNSENTYHSSPNKGDNKWTLKKETTSTNGKVGGPQSTARKSTTPRLPARKSTSSQRAILLVTKKGAAAPAVSAKKKVTKVSPQRRRGIIQGDSPMKGEYTCSYCQKIFNTKEAIKVHEEVYHTGRYKSMPSSSKSPLFECTECGKSYMSKHALEEHLYTHVGMRPFACPYCAASFNHRKSLRRHVQLHNNVKRFDCPQCSKTFIRKDALDSHLRIHKAEEEEVEEAGGEEPASGSDVTVGVTKASN